MPSYPDAPRLDGSNVEVVPEGIAVVGPSNRPVVFVLDDEQKREIANELTKNDKPKEKDTSFTQVQSSNVESVAHDSEANKLLVRFHNGAEWEYDNVDEPTYHDVLGSESVGKAVREIVATKTGRRRN